MTLIPDRHALLGPSGAHQWMACPPSARLSEGAPDSDSQYTREGTVAHRLAELRLREAWEGKDITEELKEVTASPFYSRSMEEYVRDYTDYISGRMAEAKTHCPDPQLLIETEVHFEDFVPEGFGTSDACIIADDVMDVIDFKFGAGVPVSARANPQMMMPISLNLRATPRRRRRSWFLRPRPKRRFHGGRRNSPCQPWPDVVSSGQGGMDHEEDPGGRAGGHVAAHRTRHRHGGGGASDD